MSGAAGRLRELLDVTPRPNGDDADVLVDQFREITRDRAAVLAQIGPLPIIDEDDREAWAEVVARDAAWYAALDGARRRIAAQLAAARKLTAYDVKSDDMSFEHTG